MAGMTAVTMITDEIILVSTVATAHVHSPGLRSSGVAAQVSDKQASASPRS